MAEVHVQVEGCGRAADPDEGSEASTPGAQGLREKRWFMALVRLSHLLQITEQNVQLSGIACAGGYYHTGNLKSSLARAVAFATGPGKHYKPGLPPTKRV